MPVDYDVPEGSTIDLGLMRLPAGNTSERIGSLLVNPGGPGVPGTDLVVNAAAIWPKRIRDRFDIVAWDPRGTGGSAPIDCVDDLDRYFAEPDPSPDTAEENEVLVDRAQEFDDACEQKNEAMLGHISTVDTTRDLDRIREALGEDTISYMGFSYGSELGSDVRDPLPDAHPGDGARRRDRSRPRRCRDRPCPGHRGRARARHVPRRLLGAPHVRVQQQRRRRRSVRRAHGEARLRSRCRRRIAGRPEVGQGVAINAVIQALYTTDLWPALADALDQAQHGDGDGLLALSDTYLERDDDGTWTNSIEAFIAISCLDDPVPRDVAAYATLADEFEKLAPRLGRSFASGYQCALWPVPSQPGPTATGAGAPPILVVGTTGDPFTPLEQTKALADALESGVLLVREGEGHTAYGQDECVDDAIDSYLIDLTVPADGTRC